MGSSGSRSGSSKPKRPHQRNLILVVDDDEDNLLFTTYAIECLGHPTIAASTGESALDLAVTQSPNLILLDILLPDISGILVLERLRIEPQTKRIPVIAVTALAHQADQQMLIAAGFNGYLAKPYMIDALSQLIQRLL